MWAVSFFDISKEALAVTPPVFSSLGAIFGITKAHFTPTRETTKLTIVATTKSVNNLCEVKLALLATAQMNGTKNPNIASTKKNREMI